jgi:SOS-response transcriptional repressor LexA
LEKRSLSCNAVEKELGFGNGAIRRWDMNSPSVDKIIKLSNLLDVSVDYLLFGSTSKQKNPTHLSGEEILRDYQLLDNEGKTVVSSVLTYTLEKMSPRETGGKRNIVPFNALPADANRDLPLYDDPASAGHGLFLDSSAYELIGIPVQQVPKQTDFLVRISGDSMEPEIEDGDVVFVTRTPTLDIGEIGIFSLDGDALCKKLMKKGRKLYLQSLNSKYPPLEIPPHNDFHTFGKVLGKTTI